MSTVEARPRAYTYRTTTEWMGRRNGRFAVPGREPFLISSPPEFKGEAAFYNPEELFVGSVEICLMLTFASLIEKQKLPVEAYYSEAVGTLEFANGELRFTRIVIKPTVIVATADANQKVRHALELAHRNCLVANSIQAEVRIEPDVLLSASE
jgi:peroxiredoxin-like protein